MSTAVVSPSKKVSLPFGSSSGKSLAYSDYAHIQSVDTVSFARAVSSSKKYDLPVNAADAAANEDKSKSKHRVKLELNNDLLKVEGTDDEEPCMNSECKRVIKAVLDLHKSNQYERVALIQKNETLLVELQLLEDEMAGLENGLGLLTQEENLLEMTKMDLKEKLASLDRQKIELAVEKEGFNGKMMVTESERQNSVKDLRAGQKALADAMWRGATGDGNDDDASSIAAGTIVSIARRSPKRIVKDNAIAVTPYDLLADNSKVVDYSELSYDKPMITSFQRTHSRSVANSSIFDDNMSAMTSNTYKQMNSSPLQSHVKYVKNISRQAVLSRVRASSPTNQVLPPGSFKGYTPNGNNQSVSRQLLGSSDSNGGSIAHVTNTYRTSVSSYNNGNNNMYAYIDAHGMSFNAAAVAVASTSIDGMGNFTSEKTRQSFGRKKKLGEIRSKEMHAELNTLLNRSLTFRN